MDYLKLQERVTKKTAAVDYAKEIVDQHKDDEEIKNTSFYKECVELSKR